MRRTVALFVLTAALAGATTAEAALEPVAPRGGDVTAPRMRSGVVHIPAAHSSGRTRVLVTLGLPPLAAARGGFPGFAIASEKLDATSRSSRAYLARVDAAQARAIAELHAAIPEANVSWRYRILLDGFTVSLPVGRLPRLVRLGFVRNVYPSLRYQLNLNRSPSVIGATALRAATGADGRGVKIAVVDGGIDQTSTFLAPSGFSYPPDFPKGQTNYTTSKVIVARSFPGPGSGNAGKLAVGRIAFHGTHVAGIAAGDAGTTAPAGTDHPAVAGLSGVAPGAWVGNYRVFTVPAPLFDTDSAETPEVVKAFEAAVADGMDVINFSGGGPESEPATDALVEAVANVAKAGVVPVISAGNDRDSFGLGTVGSPAAAPDAIAVAAVSNSHTFGAGLAVLSPALSSPNPIPFAPAGDQTPDSWSSADQTLVDVGAITGRDGKPLERHLCGPANNPEGSTTQLPAGSLDGKIALVSRGLCSLTSKASRVRAAGGIGLIIVDDRPGDLGSIGSGLGSAGGIVSDLDGARMREAMAQAGGRLTVRVERGPLEIQTDRSAVPTSFSAGGPTAFGHLLKPDIAAPGGQILSATLPSFSKEPFAVFDGTSMAAPHIAGAAALLLQRHPTWSPRQVKSALMSTAGPAFADTGRTIEAPVLLEGAGLASLTAADDPKIFSDPQSLSFGDLNVNGGAQSRQVLVTVSDLGGGAGTWLPELQSQQTGAGVTVGLPGPVLLSPGGTATFQVTAAASADAAPSDNYGFLVLRQGDVVRRIPYFFSVTRPRLASAPVVPLKALNRGDTRRGQSRASVYRWPAAPFGTELSFDGKPPVNETGAERVYSIDVKRRAVNVGVAVVSQSSRSLIDPWFLGSLDENDVQGYAGTPVNVQELTVDYRQPVEAAGAVFPKPGRYYVAVDSGRDPSTGRSLAGSYTLRSWIDDVKPPKVTLLTERVASGRPAIAVRITDDKSGVDPLSIIIGYGTTLLPVSLYDPSTKIALIGLPAEAPPLKVGRRQIVVVASDFQEAKNVNTIGGGGMPNTAFAQTRLTVASGPALTWLAPERQACVSGTARLLVLASDTAQISSIAFYDGQRRIARVVTGAGGLYFASWKAGAAGRGRHTLRAVLSDRDGREASATRAVRVCGK